MGLIFLILFGMVNFKDYNSLVKVINNSKDLEFILCQMRQLKDEKPQDEYKSPEAFLKDGWGDCDDYARFVYDTLGDKEYHVSIEVVIDDQGNRHAICNYEKGKDWGLFSNSNRYPRKDSLWFAIDNNYTRIEWKAPYRR